jgi:hypothetical protein
MLFAVDIHSIFEISIRIRKYLMVDVCQTENNVCSNSAYLKDDCCGPILKSFVLALRQIPEYSFDRRDIVLRSHKDYDIISLQP